MYSNSIQVELQGKTEEIKMSLEIMDVSNPNGKHLDIHLDLSTPKLFFHSTHYLEGKAINLYDRALCIPMALCTSEMGATIRNNHFVSVDVTIKMQDLTIEMHYTNQTVGVLKRFSGEEWAVIFYAILPSNDCSFRQESAMQRNEEKI